MLGAEGIAVGLSTRVLPHNFCELIEAQIAILQGKPFTLLPDFPQGGIMDASGYAKGTGKIKLRAVIEPKAARRRARSSSANCPAGTTTDSLIASIEDAARKKKIRIKSIDDFTAEHVEIEIKLAPGEDPKKTIAALYLFTECEQSVSGAARSSSGATVRWRWTWTKSCAPTRVQLLALLKQELELRRGELRGRHPRENARADFHRKPHLQEHREVRDLRGRAAGGARPGSTGSATSSGAT